MKTGLQLLAVLLLVIFNNPSRGCSAFTISSESRVLMAKSYDWNVGNGVVLTNPKGPRIGIPTGYSAPMEWFAKYGSITFNQYGRFMPNGGLNEAGLAIEVLWLDETQYPLPTNNAVVNELQWVQYHLDCFATVDEVVESNQIITIVPTFAKLHYYVADKTGNSAVVEFINGQRVVHYGANLNCKAITNDTYANSVNYQNISEKGKSKAPMSSVNRFTHLYREISGTPSFTDSTLVSKAFSLLDRVWVKGWTKWNILYDLTNRRVWFKTNLTQARKEFCLADFELNEGASQQFIDINNFLNGNVAAQFGAFNDAINFELISNSAKLTGVELPGNLVELMATHPNRVNEMAEAMSTFYSSVANIVIEVSGLKGSLGSVSIGIFDSEEAFTRQKPINGGRIRVSDEKVRLVAYNVPFHREYAVGYFHDANSNDKLDTNFLGIPTERYGFSGKGKRKFHKAKFKLVDKNTHVTL